MSRSKYLLSLIAPAALLLLAGISGCRPGKEISPVKDCAVRSSEWVKVNLDFGIRWNPIDDQGTIISYEASIPAEELSPEVLNNSLILIYARLKGYSQTISSTGDADLLPLNLFYGAIGGSVDEWNAAAEPGRIVIRLKNTQILYSEEINLNPDHEFRYIVIPKNAGTVDGQKPNAPNPLAKYTEEEIRNLGYTRICEEAGITR